MTVELMKEQSRIKIEKLRQYHGDLINLNNSNLNDDENPKDSVGLYNEEFLDNAVRNGGDVMTMSLFYRPSKNLNESMFYTSDGLP